MAIIKDYWIPVCVPSRDLWKAEFGMCMFNMAARCHVDHSRPLQDFRVYTNVLMASGSGIAELRNTLVARALKNPDVSHILFADDDQMFPDDTIHQLVKHDLPIVGANIVRKEANPRTNSRSLEGDFPVWTHKKSTGIQEVDYVGTGIMLIKREVFEKLAEPYFFYDVKSKVGEDVYFCTRAKEAGYEIFIDHDLSKKVKHVGHFYWGHEHTNSWNDE
jgi:hypothetical protein